MDTGGTQLSQTLAGSQNHQDAWRSSWESLVNLNLEICISSLAGPAGQHDHASAPHVARHAGTEGFKMALGAARNRPTVRGSGAFGNEAYVRVPIPQGRSTGGNSPTTTMAVGWGLTSLRLEIGSGPLTGPAVRPWPPPAPPSDATVDTEGPKDTWSRNFGAAHWRTRRCVHDHLGPPRKRTRRPNMTSST